MFNLFRRYAIHWPVLFLAFFFAISVTPFAADDVPLAIKGYDPVAYFTDAKPTRGLLTIKYVWDEHLYYFSRPEHRELFKADPVRYAPQFADFCTMALTRGKVVEANPEYWLINEGKLYIFAIPEGPNRFRQDPEGNIAKANQNRMLIPKR